MSNRHATPKLPSLESAPFHSIYAHELLWLAANIVHKADRVFAMPLVPELPENALTVDSEVHTLLASILSDASGIKNLISDFPRRGTARAASMRRQRIAALNTMLDGISITEIRDRKVRNSLEHFDEYLDDANEEFEGRASTGRRAFYNISISRRSAIEAQDVLYPIRLYVADERVFENFGVKIDIGKIYDEAVAIRDRVSMKLGIKDDDKRGGLMVPF